MEPNDIRFGGGAAGTVLNPLVAVALLIAVVLILVWPRRRIIVPWLGLLFLVPSSQVIVLGGAHFTIYRVLVVFGLIRLAAAGRRGNEPRLVGGFTNTDWAFTLCALALFVTFCLQWMVGAAVIKALGNLLDALGGYFVLRFLIRDSKDVRQAIRVLAIVALIEGTCMLNEQISHRNVFGLLGGGLEQVVFRDGKPRAMGSFEVYITAGAFGGTLLPLLIWLWQDRESRRFAIAGLIGATLMTITSNASTSLLTYVGGIVALCFWPMRRRMREFRWGIVITLIGLQMVMKAPVWALIQRIDLTGSSSGYQRFELVNQCILHFSEWWLMGTVNYSKWGFDMWDLSNQYVANAVTGGLGAIVPFILVISRSFGRLGTARRRAGRDLKKQWYFWCLGAALLAHVVAYFGIGYFDQMQFAWYALLAMIPAATSNVMSAPALRNQPRVPIGLGIHQTADLPTPEAIFRHPISSLYRISEPGDASRPWQGKTVE